jgi:hypothetical protein
MISNKPILLLGLWFAVVAAPSGPAELPEVEALPDLSLRPKAPAESLSLGGSVQWTLGPRLPKGSASTASTDHKGVTVTVEKDRPIEIVVEADRGVPVVMLTDGPIHPLDGRAFAGAYDPENPLPGAPLAYAIGTGQRVRLVLTPSLNGTVHVWVWVLPGPLKAQEPVELPPEMMSAFREQGYSEEAIRLLLEVPDIVRAWQASDVEKPNP